MAVFLAPAVFRAVVFRAVVLRAGALRVVALLAVVFLAVVFLAGALLAGALLAVVFLAVDFLAVERFAVDVFAVERFAVDLRPPALAAPVDFAAVVFLAVAFFAAAGAGGHTPRSSLGARLVFTTASLKPLSGVMRAFLDALILTGSWVWGLRPMRAGRSTLTNLAKPEIDTGSPLDTTAVTTWVKPSSTVSTSLRSTPVCVETAWTRSRRFTGSS